MKRTSKVRRGRVCQMVEEVVKRRLSRLGSVLRGKAEASKHREAAVLDLALLHRLEDSGVGGEVERVERASGVAVFVCFCLFSTLESVKKERKKRGTRKKEEAKLFSKFSKKKS